MQPVVLVERRLLSVDPAVAEGRFESFRVGDGLNARSLLGDLEPQAVRGSVLFFKPSLPRGTGGERDDRQVRLGGYGVSFRRPVPLRDENRQRFYRERLVLLLIVSAARPYRKFTELDVDSQVEYAYLGSLQRPGRGTYRALQAQVVGAATLAMGCNYTNKYTNPPETTVNNQQPYTEGFGLDKLICEQRVTAANT